MTPADIAWMHTYLFARGVLVDAQTLVEFVAREQDPILTRRELADYYVECQ